MQTKKQLGKQSPDLSFSGIFEGPAAFGKELEVRWFNNKTKQGSDVQHQMPFLRRNLSYVKIASRGKSKKQKEHQQRQNQGTGIGGGDKEDRAVFCQNVLTAKKNKNTSTLSSSVLKLLSENNRLRKRKRTDAGGKSAAGAKSKKLVKDLHRASAFGKSFPPYRPLEMGEWLPPRQVRSAFQLYSVCMMGRDAAEKMFLYCKKSNSGSDEKDSNGDHDNRDDDENNNGSNRNSSENGEDDEDPSSTSFPAKAGRNRQDRATLKKMQQLWKKRSTSEEMYWKQEEAWDKQRYLHEKYIYDNARGGIDLDYRSSLSSVNTKWVENEVLVSRQMGIVHYYYLYYGGERMDTIQVQEEIRFDRRCPFCFFNASTDAGLLIHCKTTHGLHLAFDGGVDEHNNLHVMVKSSLVSNNNQHNPPASKNDEISLPKDFTFIAPKRDVPREDILNHKVQFLAKSANLTSCLNPTKRKRIIRELELQQPVRPEALSQYVVREGQDPVRQYYHSRTITPMSQDEWLTSVDSDDEDDNGWINLMGDRFMSDLGDVSSKEKIFMTFWNRFMKCNTVIADGSIPEKCREFILKHRKQLLSLNLRDDLLLHLMNLWDNQLMSSTMVLTLMKLFDGIKTKANT